MEEYREIYESKRVELVRNLRVHRTFVFDYLRSKQILDKGDCELIQAEVTSERKAGKLLDLLAHKGKNGFVCFTEALQLQSPELYEMLTGKDAESTPNPILMRYQNTRLGREGGMEAVEMELLTEHLSRSYAELQRISSQYNTMVREKRKLEGQLMMNEADLERQKCQVTAWEERFYKEKTCSLKKQSRAQKWLHALAFEIEQGRETIKTLETNIIALRMELLQANQEVEELKTKLNDANTKKDQAIRHHQEIGDSYEKERKQASRLSLILQCQEGELQVLDGYKRRCGDLELSNSQLKDENDKLKKELNELAKWTKGLKDRFDLLENDNIRALENNRNVAHNIKALQDETKELRRKSSYLEVENDFLKLRVMFAEKDCDIYKQQRDNAMICRNEAVEERDKVWRERELAWHHYIEIQKARDLEIEKRVACMKELDAMQERFNETASELAKTKLKLNEAKLTVEEMKINVNYSRTNEGTNDKENESTVESEANVNSSDNDHESTQVCSRSGLINSVRRRVKKSVGDKGTGMASTSHMTLSNRKGNVDFLLSFLSDLTDDTDDIDDVFSKNTMNRWNSCPQLDEISNKEENTNTTDFAVNIARHSLTALSLPDLSDLCSSSGNPEVVTKDTRDFNKSQGADQDSDSYSSDSDGEKRFPDHPFSESDGEGHSEKQPFRKRTNVVSSLRRTALVSTRQSPRKENPIPRGASIVSSRESPSGEKPLQHLKNVVPTKGNK